MDAAVKRLKPPGAVVVSETKPANRAAAVYQFLKKHFSFAREKAQVLEIGCGRGELARRLCGEVAQLTAIDNAPESLAAFRRQSAAAGELNLTIQEFDAERDAHLLPRARFDLIVSVMTLHRFATPAKALGAWRRALQAAGFLCLVELRDAGRPYYDAANAFAPRQGFVPEELAGILARCGYFSVELLPVLDFAKMTAAGGQLNFQLFAAIAVKTPPLP